MIDKSEIKEYLQNWEIGLRKDRMRLLQLQNESDKQLYEEVQTKLKHNSTEYDLWCELYNYANGQNPKESILDYLLDLNENKNKKTKYNGLLKATIEDMKIYFR